MSPTARPKGEYRSAQHEGTPVSSHPAAEREALRQRMLLRALWRNTSPTGWQGWLRTPSAGVAAGLAAYRRNAAAVAERALAAAYPTVAALVGTDSFGAMARDFWRHHPPERGDLAQWGAELPGFIGSRAQLSDEPYLADSARLDWLVHRAAGAADAVDAADALTESLHRLASVEPAGLGLTFAPGAALLASAWPVATIWQAHQRAADDPLRFADVRAAFDAQRGESAWVWRDGYAVRVAALDPGEATFTRALLEGRSLAAALDAAGDEFTFERWLARALSSRWLVQVELRNLE